MAPTGVSKQTARVLPVARTSYETTTIAFELPTEFVKELGSADALTAKARQALVLQLLRDAEITQGQAAILLGITRYDILDLMAEHHILSGPLTAEEMRQDIENARRFTRQS
jgi:predicted HTH domain antitoxin